MKWATYIAGVCLLMLAAGAAAQQSVRIGYVDTKRLLDNAPQVVAGRDQLDIEFRDRNDAVVTQEQRLAELEQQLQDINPGTEEYLQLQREFRNLQRAVDRLKEDLREELNFRRNEIYQELEELIGQVIKGVAEENQYDLIISNPVAYASDTIDITDLILERLHREFDSDLAEAGN